MTFLALKTMPERTAGGPRLRTAARTFAAGSALLLASCSDGKVPLYPVAGAVKYGTEVPVGAQVLLHPQGHTLPAGVAPSGSVAEDGTFKIGTYDLADGAPAGEYKATFQWFKVVKSEGGVGRGPNVLPATYGDPAKSPVTVTVKDGENALPPVEIKKKK